MRFVILYGATLIAEMVNHRDYAVYTNHHVIYMLLVAALLFDAGDMVMRLGALLHWSTRATPPERQEDDHHA